jgi:hypothetical protein
VAAEKQLSVDQLMEQIAKIDEQDAGDKLARHHNLPPTMFDRDLEPLTLGQWAALHESIAYRFIRQTILPNWHWIATIWQGVNEEMGEPPIVMESAVFDLSKAAVDRLPDHLHHEIHATLQEALDAHERLARQYSTP